jgi:uncharacterized repeat protein (TIGR01451 family)
MTYLRSDPPARVIGNELSWDLGDLAPQDRRSISITCRPERNGSVRFSVRVDSADTIQGQRLAAEASVNTHVFTSALSLNVTGPNTANVGDTVTFEIEVSNTGFETLNNIVIRDQLPAGLVHPTDPGSVIQKLFGSLAAGESRKIAVKLIVRQTGRLCHTVDVTTAVGGHSASATACLEARDPPKPDLQVTIDGPEQRRVGEMATYTVRVKNTGEATLTNVRIVSNYDDASLFPRQATPGYDAGALRMQREFNWPAGRLARGEIKSFGMEFECVNEAAAAWCRVSAEAAEGVRKVEDARTRILPLQRPPVRPDGPPPRIPDPRPPKQRVGDTGELKLSIAVLRNPIAIDTTTEHRIVVENARNVSDRNIELTIHIPRGMDYVGLSGPAADRSMSPDRRTVQVRVAELRPNEKLSFLVKMRGLDLGKHIVKVSVNSLESEQPVEAEEDTTVNKTG